MQAQKFRIIYNCRNNGNITGYFAGGIVSHFGNINHELEDFEGNLNIRYCDNNGEISGRVSGGILGFCRGDGPKRNRSIYASVICIDNTINRAKVQCVNKPIAAGGIVGLIKDGVDRRRSYFQITNVANVGVINSNSDEPAGGIVGYEDDACDVHVYNSYTVDEIYNTKEGTRGAIFGDTDDDYTDWYNVYVVGSKNLILGNGDCTPKGEDDDHNNDAKYHLSYGDLISGRLCY